MDLVLRECIFGGEGGSCKNGQSQLEYSPQILAPVAEYSKVLSEVSRLQVLCSLKSGAKNVTEIIQETGLGQANVSKHLKVLTQAGIVTRQPQGIIVFMRSPIR